MLPMLAIWVFSAMFGQNLSVMKCRPICWDCKAQDEDFGVTSIAASKKWIYIYIYICIARVFDDDNRCSLNLKGPFASLYPFESLLLSKWSWFRTTCGSIFRLCPGRQYGFCSESTAKGPTVKQYQWFIFEIDSQSYPCVFLNVFFQLTWEVSRVLMYTYV